MTKSKRWTANDIAALQNKGVKSKNVFGTQKAFSPPSFDIIIGVDPGKNTGYAVWDKRSKSFQAIRTYSIIEAIDEVKRLHSIYLNCLLVVIEDARLWTHHNDKELAAIKAQGAGSVKRDCTIWQDELTRCNINFQMKQPSKQRNAYAYDVDLFTRTTGYIKKTSEHARVAAMLVYKFN